MPSTYTKPFEHPTDLVMKLQGRGLVVADVPSAIDALRSIGYYALSGYWYPMRKTVSAVPLQKSEDFIAGATFEHALRIFEFDKVLRAFCIEALERIERVLKVEIALRVGHLDAFGHTNSSFMKTWFTTRTNAKPKSNHDKWLDRHEAKYRARGDIQIQEFIGKYGEPLPIWVAIEAMDFGDASTLLNGLNGSHQNVIAQRFGVVGGSDLSSMMRAMTQIRNTCAHHDRLWNRVHVNHARMPVGAPAQFFSQLPSGNPSWNRTYPGLLVLAYLHSNVLPRSDWPKRLAQHLVTLEVGFGVTESSLGAPTGWQSHPIWN